MKTNRIKTWRKRALCLALIICALALVATGTYAYFAAEKTAYNVITTGSLHMELVEETTGGKPWPEEGIKNVMPGTAVDKTVYVENEGSVAFYVRIGLEQQITAGPGVEAELSFEHITLDLNEEAWVEQDGYYYYHRALEPGEKTEPLFTKVTFEPEMGNEYMNATVEVYVLAQAVQSANNGDSPLAAQGWSEPAKTVIENVNAPETEAE